MPKVPERQTLTIPGFHDGWLTSIAVADKLATLGLKTSDGVVFEFRLIGIEAFCANNFRQGNIILNFEVVKGTPPIRTDVDARLAYLFPPPHPDVASSYHEAHGAHLVAAAERVAKGGVALVNLEASYGCELVALCSEVQLIAHPD